MLLFNLSRIDRDVLVPELSLSHYFLIEILFIYSVNDLVSIILSKYAIIHGENFMAIFTTLNVVIWFSTGTLGIFATLVYAFTMRVVIHDILSMAIIPALSTSILFCNLCYILL